MTEGEGLALLKACTTPEEWNRACDKIKHAHGGDYPAWWFESVMMSGLMNRITSKF